MAWLIAALCPAPDWKTIEFSTRVLDRDGVIHLAFVVPSVTSAATQADAKAIETFVASLAGTGKPPLVSGATIATPGPPST